MVLVLLVLWQLKTALQMKSEKQLKDTRPTVSVEQLSTIEHQVTLTSFGEVKPLETTRLAAQVSGEVISWHPNFVAGGIVIVARFCLQLKKTTIKLRCYKLRHHFQVLKQIN